MTLYDSLSTQTLLSLHTYRAAGYDGVLSDSDASGVPTPAFMMKFTDELKRFDAGLAALPQIPQKDFDTLKNLRSDLDKAPTVTDPPHPPLSWISMQKGALANLENRMNTKNALFAKAAAEKAAAEKAAADKAKADAAKKASDAAKKASPAAVAKPATAATIPAALNAKELKKA